MISDIIKAIHEGQSFLITAHVRLDGDALGSELAFYLMLRDMGKKAVVYNQDRTPERYQFLPAAHHITHSLTNIEQYDTCVVLDCSDLSRVGEEADRLRKIKKLINIDHHVSNNGFCPLKMLDAKASSTGELVFRLMQEMRIKMTRDICTNLYAAIITDTGSFRYSSTTKETFMAAGVLVGEGANPQRIAEGIYESDSPARLKLLAKALSTLSLDLENKIGSMVVTQKDLQETGAAWEHTEGFVDIPRTVLGIEVSVLYTQRGEDHFKLSLRSKAKFNVEKVAKKFGGGGHIHASSCWMKGDIETIKSQIIQAVREL
ncbi:MAG TPA: bifunctional oligoribonuclease/PAP phosphatase NrnA [Smithella sp.]|nr:bifunctional oligoribonuclease/PAP phosphatase NrnA [Smithella sp.]MDM7987971.1 bifunctional oligoribonuclease/PAP phosphatase NrnA [Smithella sp.]HNY51269.1 bifunctional oligoribonuclease/PAP phosphatase NrnA [Smithella sp.]HOG91067.1 bifunctional oligoribonuclease/PAP phosphatase NrnA [Smithella sp.]HOU51978.1 bifunctional oligoribonuclease/PAP phosphatase NrnA [Smithella sp.]